MTPQPHQTETHPFEPFLPPQARLLLLGTFPPAEKRWSMRFYYPNFQNDMWRIVGHCFFGNKQHFVAPDGRSFSEARLRAFLTEQGIALYDTCTRIVRTQGTASDKDLHVVQPTDLTALLRQLPCCHTIATAGQLASELCAAHFGVVPPKVGQWVAATHADGRQLRLYRMPSSSRAYPMSVEQKAVSYARLFADVWATATDKEESKPKTE